MGNDHMDQDKGNSINQDAVMNLANNLFKNENTFDFSSIMRMATNLLSNDALMNSVQAIGQSNPAPAQAHTEMSKPVQETTASATSKELEGNTNTFTDNNLVDQLAKLAASALSAEEALMNLEPEMDKNHPIATTEENQSPTGSDISEYAVISKQLEQIAKDIMEIKNDLKALKKEDLKPSKASNKAEKKQKKKK